MHLMMRAAIAGGELSQEGRYANAFNILVYSAPLKRTSRQKRQKPTFPHALDKCVMLH